MTQKEGQYKVDIYKNGECIKVIRFHWKPEYPGR